MNLDNLKSKTREATINTLNKAMINGFCSIEKDGGVWSAKALAKTILTQLPTTLAVEAVTGSFLAGACTGVIADIGRIQVEGHLYAKKIMEERDQRQARDQDADFVPVTTIV